MIGGHCVSGVDTGVPKGGVLDCKCARVHEIFDHTPNNWKLRLCAHSFGGFKHHDIAAGVNTT